MSSLTDYTPEQQRELDAYRAKLAESTTTLDVTPMEFLDYLKTLDADELVALEYDRAFREWKQWLEVTHDAQLLGLTIAFMTAKPNLRSIETSVGVLRSVSRNPWLLTSHIDVLIRVSAALKMDLEEWLAFASNLSEVQASRLVDTNDLWVWHCLAHNHDMHAQTLDVIANNLHLVKAPRNESQEDRVAREKQMRGIKAEILNNPACTDDAREIINPDTKVLELAAQLAKEAQEERELDLDFLDDEADKD